MMNEQYRDLQAVSKFLEVADDLIIIGITRVARCLSDHLEGVNGNQNRIRMLRDKGFDLIRQPIRNGTGRDGKENILRNIPCDVGDSGLYPAPAIFQTQIQGRSLCCVEVPDGFSRCDADAPFQNQPRLTGLGRTAEHGNTLRQNLVDTVAHRLNVHGHKRMTADGFESNCVV